MKSRVNRDRFLLLNLLYSVSELLWSSLQLKWIKSKIGLVSQEPVLFMCSIKDNIAYGKEGATLERIKAAAELANAAKFIDKLPQV